MTGQAESTAAREGSVVVVPRKNAKLARLGRLHIIRARAEAAAAPNDERLHNWSRWSSADDKDDSATEAASPSSSHGAVSLIGKRREMEDAVTAARGFASSVADGRIPVPAAYDFFGVYDGHCGASVACACRDRLHVVLAEEVAALGRWPKAEDQWRAVMEASFSRMDRELAAPGETEEGSTAVVAVVAAECIVVANCGDSRALLCRGGVAVPLSSDHKPDRPDEKKRVEAAGGRVVNWDVYRVSGVLAVSRSLGDHYLRPYVISVPEVTVTERSTEDELLILASDGLWDVVSNETSCRVASRYLNRQPATKASEKKRREPSAAQAAALLAELAYSRGSRDNISVVVVRL